MNVFTSATQQQQMSPAGREVFALSTELINHVMKSTRSPMIGLNALLSAFATAAINEPDHTVAASHWARNCGDHLKQVADFRQDGASIENALKSVEFLPPTPQDNHARVMPVAHKLANVISEVPEHFAVHLSALLTCYASLATVYPDSWAGCVDALTRLATELQRMSEQGNLGKVH